MSQHIVGTESGTNAAIDADERFVVLLVPEYGTKRTGVLTLLAGDTQLRVERYAAAISWGQCLSRTSSCTWRMLAGAADDDDEAFSHATSRANTDARFANTPFACSSSASEHAELTSNTAININDRKPLDHEHLAVITVQELITRSNIRSHYRWNASANSLNDDCRALPLSGVTDCSLPLSCKTGFELKLMWKQTRVSHTRNSQR